MGKCTGQIPAALGRKAKACDSDSVYRLWVNGKDMGELCGSCALRFEKENKATIKNFPNLIRLEEINPYDRLVRQV